MVLVLPEGSPDMAERPLHWEIRDEQQQVLRQGTIDTAGYLHNSPLILSFEPLDGGQRVELALSAPPEAEIALWTSLTDNYVAGSIADNDPDGGVDLYFTMRAQESPLSLLEHLRASAGRWRSTALWIPLLVITPGWLLIWLLRPGGRRPTVPLAAGVSLSLAPLVYLWSGLIGLRLYEPLVQSLFQASLLLLLLLMVRNPSRVRVAWVREWVLPLMLVGVMLLLSSVTWLLAARGVDVLAIPGLPAIVTLGEELVREGVLEQSAASLPEAALAATLTQVSRQPVEYALLLGALLLAVSLVPSLYGLAGEITGEAWSALWVLPLAWLWPSPWQTVAQGDFIALYHITLLPVAVALGLRALRVTENPWGSLLLAAVPLAALILSHGAAAGVPWFLTLLLALLFRRPLNQAQDDQAGETAPLRWPEMLVRAWLWLFMAVLLWFPAWLQGADLAPAFPSLRSGYLLLLATVLVAVLASLARRLSNSLVVAVAVLILVFSPALLWWRSAPLRHDITLLSAPAPDSVPAPLYQR